MQSSPAKGETQMNDTKGPVLPCPAISMNAGVAGTKLIVGYSADQMLAMYAQGKAEGGEVNESQRERIMQILHPYLDTGDSRTAADFAVAIYAILSEGEPMPNYPDDELCAKCNFTRAGHVSNTGVIYPCWTPSGKYKKRANLAALTAALEAKP
jgi:hypothetical protein